MSRRGKHDHAPLTDRAREVVLVSAACKRAATETLDCRPRKIICREIRNRDHILKPDTAKVSIKIVFVFVSVCVISLIVCWQISRHMYHAKRKLLPTLPKTGTEAVMQFSEEIQIETSRGEEFSFVGPERDMILFTCDTNLR